MKRALILVLMLAACRDEVAQAVDPVKLTDEAIGHYCQMNLTEHPGPKAQVHLDGLPGAPLFFSQVRDAIAYSRLPEQSHTILAIWVNDMGAPGATWDAPGAANWIDAKTAHYVVGSAREGGMGAPELVPFSDAADAGVFADQYGGVVMGLADVPDSAVIAPVADVDPAGSAEDDKDFKGRLRALSQRNEG
jgi:copper chaperone NosL